MVMTLRVRLPTRLFLETPVTRIVAISPNGSFGLLPRHADVVTPLAPGMLRYRSTDGTERFLGVREGVLVKCGESVEIAVRDALLAEGDKVSRGTVQRQLEVSQGREQRARAALARLEAGFIRFVLEHETPHHG